MQPRRYHVFLILISNAFLLSHAQWTVFFNPDVVLIQTKAVERVHLILTGLTEDVNPNINDNFRLISENEQVAVIADEDQIEFVLIDSNGSAWETYFEVKGVLSSYSESKIQTTRIFVEIKTQSNTTVKSKEMVSVTVIMSLPPPQSLETMFSVTIAIMMSFMFINFGAAIDLSVMKEILKKPVAPAIGTVCQLVFMPLLAYGLGFGLFFDAPELALGLFLTGISPAGGASNIWALLLGGNMNLSIVMTTISTLASFGTIPLWLFVLGETIAEQANIGVPYLRMTLVAGSLLVPLTIGLGIQKCLPKLAKFLVRILKPFSFVAIAIVISSAFLTNIHLLQLVSWKVVLVGFGLPIIGYCFGYITALIFQRSNADLITIGIETGFQNTALTMFLVTFSLEQPTADRTMIVPITVALATPIPLMVLLAIKKVISYSEYKTFSKIGKEPAVSENNLTKF